MEILYRIGRGTVYDIIEQMTEPPSYSSVRTVMGTLVRKEIVSYERCGMNYVYAPMGNRKTASRSALKTILSTFFSNSANQAVLALLDTGETDLSNKDLSRIRKILQDSKSDTSKK